MTTAESRSQQMYTNKCLPLKQNLWKEIKKEKMKQIIIKLKKTKLKLSMKFSYKNWNKFYCSQFQVPPCR